MPMDFPDLNSLCDAAEVWGYRPFRKFDKVESVEAYREALADHVQGRDLIESQEIRTGVGWDQWSDEQNRDLLKRGGMPS